MRCSRHFEIAEVCMVHLADVCNLKIAGVSEHYTNDEYSDHHETDKRASHSVDHIFINEVHLQRRVTFEALGTKVISFSSFCKRRCTFQTAVSYTNT